MSNTVIDIDTAVAAQQENNKQGLVKVLPKLAKRLTSNSNSNSNTGSPAGTRSTAKAFGQKQDCDVSPIDDRTSFSDSDNFERTKNRRQSRGSVYVAPAEGFSSEIEELRTRDIQPDANSAAERALAAAAAKAAANATSSRESHRYDKTTFDEGDVKGVPKRKVEGRVIQQDHAQYALTYGMMLGIRVTTGRRVFYNMEREYQMRRQQSPDSAGVSSALGTGGEERELTREDFDYALELAFPPEGTSNTACPTPPHKLNFQFKFKDYMSNVFRAVRSLSGISEADYMMSLAGDFNYIEFIANSKSGQFFFYSHDGKYMIKTQTKEECVLLREIMPAYVRHLNAHPDSLLVRFYGMHRVKMKSLRSKIHFVIMSSVFDTDKPVHLKFDLKGSTIGRLTDDRACATGAVQKDLNLMKSGRKLRLGPENVRLFRDMLRADAYFLRDLNIMDYSLLVGIHDRAAGSSRTPQRRRSSGVVLSKNQLSPAHMRGLHLEPDPAQDANTSVFQSFHGGMASSPEAHEIYYLGLIDILQLYNTGKKMETFFKGFTNDRRQLSSVDPGLYADRMLEFVLRHTDYDQYDHDRAEVGAGDSEEEEQQEEEGQEEELDSEEEQEQEVPQPAAAGPGGGADGSRAASSRSPPPAARRGPSVAFAAPPPAGSGGSPSRSPRGNSSAADSSSSSSRGGGHVEYQRRDQHRRDLI